MKKILSLLAALAVLVATSSVWKPTAKKLKWFVVATNIYQDAVRRFRLSPRQIGQPAAAAGNDEDLRRDLKRINETFDGYRDRIGSSGVGIVLELGPGMNTGVALRFAATGAGNAVAIDKFVPLQDTGYTRRRYIALRAELSEEERTRFNRAIRVEDRIRLDSSRVRCVYGKALEELAPERRARSFNLTVSNAVLEEIYDPYPVFSAMDTVFRPGGHLIHNSDLGDYGMFSKHVFHPLEFLTIPDWVYRDMVESSGQPNRRLAPPPNTLQPGVDYPAHSVALVREIRPRLLERHRTLSDEDMIIRGITLVARKAGSAESPNPTEL